MRTVYGRLGIARVILLVWVSETLHRCCPQYWSDLQLQDLLRLAPYILLKLPHPEQMYTVLGYASERSSSTCLRLFDFELANLQASLLQQRLQQLEKCLVCWAYSQLFKFCVDRVLQLRVDNAGHVDNGDGCPEVGFGQFANHQDIIIIIYMSYE